MMPKGIQQTVRILAVPLMLSQSKCFAADYSKPLMQRNMQWAERPTLMMTIVAYFTLVLT